MKQIILIALGILITAALFLFAFSNFYVAAIYSNTEQTTETVQNKQPIEIMPEKQSEEIAQEKQPIEIMPEKQSAETMQEKQPAELHQASGISVKEHTLSSSSKHMQYLWRDASGKVPQYKVYVYTPENCNGHRVFIDAGHGNNSFAEASEYREKIYPVPDDRLTGMNTDMVGSNAMGIGVEPREFLNIHNHMENEPQFALKIALNVKDKLLSQGYCVILSRNSDNQNLSNGARSVLAGETSDIMVSIHSNASVNKTSYGTLALYPGDKDYLSGEIHPGYTKIMGLTKNIKSSKQLADIMSTGISAKTGLKNLGSHTAVLRIFSYSSIPTFLI